MKKFGETLDVNPDQLSDVERELLKKSLGLHFNSFNHVRTNIWKYHKEVRPTNYGFRLPHFSRVLEVMHREENWSKESFDKVSDQLAEASKDLNMLINDYDVEDLYSNDFKKDFNEYILKYNEEFKGLLRELRVIAGV
ncbi:hypothetical protein [Lentibacillus saliphilus]|uniref:hypothetical protein n=1 Tax=Lentibacillus saliphilus TaxID=2737028 RepID=UPI001C30179C|nr:hypothetical protein [Lentibacillus saliphilus]